MVTSDADPQGAPPSFEPQMPIPRFYRNVPVVDLRPQEREGKLPVLSANGRKVGLRIALALVALLGVYLLQDALSDRSAAEARVADVAADIARAEGRLAEAQDIEVELATVKAAAEVPALDYAYLTGGGQAFTGALGAVLSLDVPGVTLVNAEAVDATGIDVRIAADSHADALEWRRVAALLETVDRVANFDPSQDGDQIIYAAVLIIVGGGS